MLSVSKSSVFVCHLVTCLVTRSVIIFQIRLARQLPVTMLVRIATAIRHFRAVKPSLYSDLVAQVRKISTYKHLSQNPCTRARKISLTRAYELARYTAILRSSGNIYFTFFFFAVCVNVSSVDTQNVRSMFNLLLITLHDNSSSSL